MAGRAEAPSPVSTLATATIGPEVRHLGRQLNTRESRRSSLREMGAARSVSRHPGRTDDAIQRPTSKQ